MKRYLFLFISILLLFNNCATTKKNFVNRPLIINKVKLTILHNNDIYKAKGNISLQKDSDNIRFKFFGPLGIEIIKGSYINSLSYFNNIENRDYSEIEDVILKKYNFKINKKCFYLFLIGDIESLYNEISKINSNNYNLNIFHNTNQFTIVNNFNSQYLKVLYKFRSSYPKNVTINIGQNNNNEFSIILDYISFQF